MVEPYAVLRIQSLRTITVLSSTTDDHPWIGVMIANINPAVVHE